MDELIAEGVTSFKLFTAYKNVFLSDDGQIFRAFQRGAENGALMMVHAENGSVIDVLQQQALEAGHRTPSSTARPVRGRRRQRRRTERSCSPIRRAHRCTWSTSPRSRRSSRSRKPGTPRIPNGMGSVEHRLDLLYRGVVDGRITLERWVEICSPTPARMFGLYGRKGCHPARGRRGHRHRRPRRAHLDRAREDPPHELGLFRVGGVRG